MILKSLMLYGSVALAMKGALLDGFVRSDGKDGVGHRRCSRRGSGESTALTRLGPPLNATDLLCGLPQRRLSLRQRASQGPMPLLLRGVHGERQEAGRLPP